MLWELVKKFDVVTNIRSASISREVGLIALELEGATPEIEAARQWLEQIGVTVEPVELNVIE